MEEKKQTVIKDTSQDKMGFSEKEKVCGQGI